MYPQILKSVRDNYGAGYVPLYCWLTGDNEDEVHEYLDEEQRAYEMAERHYYQVELPKVREELQLMKEDFPEEERNRMRREYLLDRIKELKKEYLKTQDKKIGKKLHQLMTEAKIFMHPDKGVSPDQIAKARQYPLKELVRHKNYMAQCPFHNDRKPSMNIRNNFFYCHACGESGDVIDFVRKRDGLSFKQAVIKLLEGRD
jgi:hypothetical protein